MDINEALDAFSDWAQERRLRVFRLLAQVGFDGMAAGDIAKTKGADAEKALAFDGTYRMLFHRISIFVKPPAGAH